jgi:hypothetical protein
MSTHKVPIEAIQRIRQYLRTELTLPESEKFPLPTDTSIEANGDDAFAMPDSLADLGAFFRMGSTLEDGAPLPNNEGHWYLSIRNPAEALIKLPGLSLKSSYRWVTYLYRLREEGCGKTWAIPECLSTTANLEKAIRQPGQPDLPPRPEGALEDCMSAIQGDRSPSSFLVASLLRREIAEFGHMGSSEQWAQHHLIASPPGQFPWQWRTEPLGDLTPKVRLLPDGKAIVEFFTFRSEPSCAIFQHLDQYLGGHYIAQSIDRPIAIAERIEA